MKRILLIIACSLMARPVVSQVEATMYQMTSLPQVVNANPAFVPKYKFSLGLPGISSMGISYANNGFAYTDLIKRQNGVLIADLAQWAKNLPDKTYISTSAQTDLFRLGLRINPKIYVTLNSTLKGNSRVMLPKEMASLLVNGTSPYIGQTINMSPEVNVTTYVETSAGLSIELFDKLRVGGRLKMLNGLVNARTERSSFGLALDENYQITATGDFSLQSSGVYNFTQSDFSFSDERKNYMQNVGFGLDLGATYEVMDKLTVAASLIDVGWINWNNNVYQYSLTNASYTFKGIDVDQLISGNSDYMNAQLDSLQKEFEMKEGAGNAYRTGLPGKMYLSGSYEVMRNFSVGALIFTEAYQQRVASGLTLMANKNLGRIISTSFSYTISNRSFNNLGAGVSFNLAPFQLYVVGDNLRRMPLSLAANQKLNPFVNNTQVFNLRAGLNIVWGWTKPEGQKNSKNATRKSKNNLKNSSQYKARKRN